MNPDRAQLAALAAQPEPTDREIAMSTASTFRDFTRAWLGPELLGPSVGEMGALFVAVDEPEMEESDDGQE